MQDIVETPTVRVLHDQAHVWFLGAGSIQGDNIRMGYSGQVSHLPRKGISLRLLFDQFHCHELILPPGLEDCSETATTHDLEGVPQRIRKGCYELLRSHLYPLDLIKIHLFSELTEVLGDVLVVHGSG